MDISHEKLTVYIPCDFGTHSHSTKPEYIEHIIKSNPIFTGLLPFTEVTITHVLLNQLFVHERSYCVYIGSHVPKAFFIVCEITILDHHEYNLFKIRHPELYIPLSAMIQTNSKHLDAGSHAITSECELELIRDRTLTVVL